MRCRAMYEYDDVYVGCVYVMLVCTLCLDWKYVVGGMLCICVCYSCMYIIFLVRMIVLRMLRNFLFVCMVFMLCRLRMCVCVYATLCYVRYVFMLCMLRALCMLGAYVM